MVELLDIFTKMDENLRRDWSQSLERAIVHDVIVGDIDARTLRGWQEIL